MTTVIKRDWAFPNFGPCRISGRAELWPASGNPTLGMLSGNVSGKGVPC
jgi:hypothetical protein